MKIVHLSDLHIGRSVSGVPMIEEQRMVLFGQIIPEVRKSGAGAVIIAGDVFDRANPAADAITLFDDFLAGLAMLETKPEIFIISGNHDSAERIAYGSRIMERSGIHLSPVYDGNVKPVTLRDEHGEIDFYMLPFVRKSTVRYFFPEEKIDSENDAIAAAVRAMKVNPDRRNVCVAHQFVTGASVSGAEESNVGGLDAVNPIVFSQFDYVALGHIHRPQTVAAGIRYCGSPLKYSFAELDHSKSITVVDLAGKGDVRISEIPLVPVNDWYDIRGTFAEITAKEYIEAHPELAEGYLRVTLTDENDIPNGYRSLQALFHNMLEMHYDNSRTRAMGITSETGGASNKSDEEIIRELFELQNGRQMNEEEINYIRKTICGQ